MGLAPSAQTPPIPQAAFLTHPLEMLCLKRKPEAGTACGPPHPARPAGGVALTCARVRGVAKSPRLWGGGKRWGQEP